MNIEVISASAGSGKTYTLEERAREAITQGHARPDAIVAITYTKKAAAELTRRLRRGLLKKNLEVEAARIRDGYLGTVHSVCQRIIGDLAFEAGSSPYPEPAPQAYSQRLFRETVGQVTRSTMGTLGPIVQVLGMQPDDSRSAMPWAAQTWRDALQRLVKQAHENRIDAAGLQRSLDHTLADLATKLLDAPVGSAESRDEALYSELPNILAYFEEQAQAELDKKGKVAGTTKNRLNWARSATRTLEQGGTPPWADLAAIGGSLFGPKKLAEVVDGMKAEFERHLSHPRLHRDLTELLRVVFGHAGEVNRAFVARKQAERLLDFEDMLAQAADVLGSDIARSYFKGRIDLLLVDEFQDTSPVQLQVIMALASIAKKTIWVGDRKQSIFGFQGSDPSLMEAATRGVLAGAEPTHLDKSYRSRPPLVGFCSDLFSAALAPYGFSRAEVALQPACPESIDHKGTHSLHLWQIIGDPDVPKAKVREHYGVAEHIRAQLASGSLLVREHLDDPRKLAPTRPAQPRDIAVLARTNVACRAIGAALEDLGIAARVAQESLGHTPEALLLRAGLAILSDPRDALAAAEVAWFSGSVPDPEAWLAERIKARADTTGPRTLPFAHIPVVAAVQSLHDRARHFAPSEALDAVMGALDLPERVLSWPDPRGHLANLEALRAVADGYQQTCKARRSAATVAGLVQHLDSLPSDTPQALPASDNAVQVLSYHRAKGLEWPIVVATTLDKEFGTKLFDVRVQPAASFDPNEPLKGRELRWWPWPYGKKSAGLELGERAKQTQVAKELDHKRRAESARLLYVGFTRARDHLCLSRVKGTAWLDCLQDDTGARVLDLPWDAEGDQVAHVGGVDWPCHVSAALGTEPHNTEQVEHSARWFARPAASTARLPQPVRPSAQQLDDEGKSQVVIAQVVRLGPQQGTNVKRGQMGIVGDAIHTFLASDPGGDDATRRAHAQRLIDSSALAGQLRATVVVDMANRFDTWLSAHTDGPRLPEWPVRWRLPDGRAMSGDIDLLVDLGQGWLLLDHKSFPGDTAQRDERLRKWAGQLAAYRSAVEQATGKPVLECWIHLPVRSEMVRLHVPRSAGPTSTQ